MNDLSKRKRVKKLKKSLADNWGQPKTDEYYNFDLINKYFEHNLADDTSAYQHISDKIWDDLDMQTVFCCLDRTTSKIGQQYLYHKLRTFYNNHEQLKKFDSLVEFFTSNKESRLLCQLELQKFNTTNAYYIEELIYGEYPQKPAWLPWAYVLCAGAIACLLSAIFYPAAILFLLPIYLVNLVIYFWNKRNINSSLLAISEFLKSIAATRKINQQEEIKAHLGEALFLSHLLGLKNKTRFINFEKRVDDDITMLVSFVFDFIKIMFNIEVLSYFHFIGSILKEHDNIHAMFRYLGEIDCALSVASLRNGTAYCKPHFTDTKKAYYQDIVHPLITNCVPNTLNLDNQNLLLTGSNMSGKTTFIRIIALNTITAQTLYTCPAKSYSAPFSRLYTSIHISDDLLESKSYYLQEVLSIKEWY